MMIFQQERELFKMPHPKPNEKHKDFIARCMRYPDMQKYDQDQRLAICYDYWRESKKKK